MREANKMIQIFEKWFGEFLINTHGFHLQDPINSPINAKFINKKVKDWVSYIEFVNYMSKNEEEFKEYVNSTSQQETFGEKGDDRNMSKELLLEQRTKILK